MTARRSRLWTAWLAAWRGQEDPRRLAAVRIAIGLVMAWDLARVARLDLVEALWLRSAAGGTIGDLGGEGPLPGVLAWTGAAPSAVWALWGASLVGSLGLALGIATRASAVLFALSYAQLGWINPAADRGIDMLVRNVAWVLAFSGSHTVWSLDAGVARLRGRPFARTIERWPRRLLALQLVVVYWMAGLQKTGIGWTPMGDFSALYVVLQDPSIAAHRFAWLAEVYPLTQAATLATMIFEWGAPLVLVAWWYEGTRTRRGWLRAQFNRYPVVLGWLGIGVLLHLGIAATMQLGIFPWAMLALYPVMLPQGVFARGSTRTNARDQLPENGVRDGSTQTSASSSAQEASTMQVSSSSKDVRSDSSVHFS